MNTENSSKGFTLIELMVVISIIGLLATVILGSLSDAKSSARDVARRLDLKNIQIAMETYHEKYGTYQIPNSGWRDGGNGWFSIDRVDYPTPTSEALYNEGLLPSPIIDDPIQRPGYMIYLCGPDRYAVSATLEKPTTSDISFIQTTCNGIGTNGTYTRYGKNFAVSND